MSKVKKTSVESKEELKKPAETIELENPKYHYHIPSEVILKKPYKLNPHQYESLKWMDSKIKIPNYGICGGLLKMDMGLGKTLTSLSKVMQMKYRLGIVRETFDTLSRIFKKKFKKAFDIKSGIGNIIREYIIADAITETPPRRIKNKLDEDGNEIVDLQDEINVYKPFCSLFVCTKTILPVIVTEIKKFFGSRLKFKIYHKEKMDKEEYEEFSFEDIEELDLLIVTYDTIRTVGTKNEIYNKFLCLDARERVEGVECKEYSNKITKKLLNLRGGKILFYYPFMNVILDESHTFSNHKSELFYSLLAINGKYKWCLTGTPFRNYSTDLFSQFKIMGYSTLINPKRFEEQYEKQNLYTYMLQVSYEDAGITLPEVNRREEYLELNQEEKEIYDYAFRYTQHAFLEFQQKKQQFANVLTLFLRLRQMCIAPYTILKESGRKKSTVDEKGGSLSDFLINKAPEHLKKWLKDKNGSSGIQSSKIKRLMSVVEEIIDRGEKVVIFSSFKRVLDLIVYAINERNSCRKKSTESEKKKKIGHLMIDGDIKINAREDIIKEFNENKKVQVMFISYKSGGQGLNLAEVCNNIILIENWWCPFVIQQAERRVNRYGQTKNVNVWRFIIKNSIEERIEKICKDKIEKANKFINGEGEEKPDKKSMRPTKETLERILMWK